VRITALALSASLALACVAATGAIDWNAAGVRDALHVGSERAVALASAPGGFLDDARIHIRPPKTLRTIGNALRAIGLGAQVDELEVGMNRAAELAAAEAKPVFADAIRAMTLQDAVNIVHGGDTAATDYFRGATEARLHDRFKPIVASSLSRIGVRRQYDAVVARYQALPFAQPANLDLDEYTTNKALDGLFLLLAEEERKIRTDPAKRTTAILRQVFGS
jgi:hypothetical protein